MQTKTMEGLIGAGMNMKMMDVPMRVYREARRKDDFAAMERAMGYAGDFAGKAQEYKAAAEEGMEEEAKIARENAEEEREEAIERRREERESLQERIEEKRKEGIERTDTVELSEEGMALLAEYREKQQKPVMDNMSGAPEGKTAAGVEPVSP